MRPDKEDILKNLDPEKYSYGGFFLLDKEREAELKANGDHLRRKVMFEIELLEKMAL